MVYSLLTSVNPCTGHFASCQYISNYGAEESGLHIGKVPIVYVSPSTRGVELSPSAEFFLRGGNELPADAIVIMKLSGNMKSLQSRMHEIHNERKKQIEHKQKEKEAVCASDNENFWKLHDACTGLSVCNYVYTIYVRAYIHKYIYLE